MRALAPVLLLLVAAAGCSAPPDEAPQPGTTGASSAPAATGTQTAPPPPATPAAPAPLSVALAGCTNFGGVFPVAMEEAQALLPDGFKPVPAAGDPLGGATLYALALKCDSFTLNGTTHHGALLAYAELAVTPDAAHALPGVTDATVPVFFAAIPPLLTDALAALRLAPAGPASVRWSETATAAVAAEATRGGDGLTLAGQVAPGAGTPLASGDFAMYGVVDRQVVGVVRGSAAGGSALQAVAALHGSGAVPLLDGARPADAGFSVRGFSLTYTAVA